MADISSFIRAIQLAARGEEVRDSLVNALNGMNDSIPDTVEEALAEAKETGRFDGPQGAPGTNGVSPVITITNASGGHVVTIKDAAHPSGQTFLIYDGEDGSDGAPGADGSPGAPGAYFTPSVDANGVLSWTNNGGLSNPASVNIRGPQGVAGSDGTNGSDGAPGVDGVSPSIVIAQITNGHRITMTDADHPSGQSFDVMDGSGGGGGGSGDMQASLYDPNNNVAAAGGIEAYFETNAQSTLTFDQTPTQNSGNPVTSGGIYTALTNRQAQVWRCAISLTDTWTGSDPYEQVVSISGASADSLIDIQPSGAVLAQMIADGARAMWVENDNGTFTVKVLGAALTTPLTLQCTVTETGTIPPASYAGGTTEITTNKVTALSASSTNTQYPSAKAVWDLFHSIVDGNEVSY